MGSRMGKYELEETKIASRAARNADLYQSETIDDYNKIDLNSNVSVLKTDAKDIDVNKIREMLDKKYRDNIPQRQSIDIDMEIEPDETEAITKDTTKEYDINEVLAKAKSSKEENYEEERLRKLRDTNYTILDNLDLKNEANADDEEDEDNEVTSEKELRELINTITQLEAKNKNQAKDIDKASEDEEDLLNLTDENDTALLPAINEVETEDEASVPIENSFYTGNLSVNDKDFDDFNDIEDDIKSNSIIIKILVFVFIIIIFAVTVFLLNKFLNWELF